MILIMVTDVRTVPSATSADSPAPNPWRERLVIAGLAFAIFVFGAGVFMALFDLLDPWVLALTALINVVAMIPICALTALALEVGQTSESHRSRRTRVGQRTLKLATVYWSAGGAGMLFAPALLFVSQF